MSETVVNPQPEATETKRTLPSDIEQTRIVAKYDVLKYLRSNRLMGVIAIEALVLVLITVIPILLGKSLPSNKDDFVAVYVNFSSFLVVIGATLFAGDAIVSEFQGRTGFLLFPNPVRRSSILVGKFISAVEAMLLIIGIYYAVALILGVGFTGGFSMLGLYSMLLAMLYAVAAVSLGFLISSLIKGSTGAIVLTFFMLLLILPVVSAMVTLGGGDPSFVLTYAANIVSNIMISPYPATKASGTAITSVPVGIVVMIAYSVICMLATYFVFKRREMSA